ncbi:RNA-binding S4 domain-containing protein, partial [Patescibacteria group bacterium]
GTKTNQVLLLDFVADQVGSKTKAKTLLNNASVSVNDDVEKNPKSKIATGDRVRIGKQRFLEVQK